ncbi:MAG: 4-(cytidine 5'-diphospho)-2-C-methyl-D-erythritol kinase [Bacillota bacterium]|nr:4-(cytidine 5'-diphospho)-2-C-methyl-D-erythritol kinase [Bacillota bacterium]
MDKIQLKARAKVNLSLDVLRKREDGYHDLKMIMQTLELHDSVCLEKISNGIEVDCNSRFIPEGEGNIAYKAAKLIMDEFSIKNGIKITIEKKIPVAAGLAGGSSNAAAVLNGMNNIFELGIQQDKLMALGKKIGADVPYCIRGGTMLAEGIGDILTDLEPLNGINIILVKPKIGVSTAYVYKNLNLESIYERPDTELIMEAIKAKNLEVIAHNMKNVLETVTKKKFSIIGEIKSKMINSGALGSMMSGSGPTVFGIFKDKFSAENAMNFLKSDRWDCFLTQTINEGMF